MSLADRWNRFWFADARYFDLALLRIGVVGFLLYFMLDSQFGALTYVLSLPDDLYTATPRVLRYMVAPFGGGAASRNLGVRDLLGDTAGGHGRAGRSLHQCGAVSVCGSAACSCRR